MLADSMRYFVLIFFFFQAEDGIRDLVRSRGLGDVYKRQQMTQANGWINGLRRASSLRLAERIVIG